MTSQMPDQELSKEASEIASEVYALLRSKPINPEQATLICLMVTYHIWSIIKSMPFEEFHIWISAQLAQVHLDNTPSETRQ